VIPFLKSSCHTLQEAFSQICEFALARNIVNYGDLVVVTAGSPFGISGTTNMLFVENIGDVLVRGEHGYGSAIYGNITHVLCPEASRAYNVHGQLIVIATCDASYLPLIRQAAGVILENLYNDHESEQYLLDVAKNLNKPVLVRADSAIRVLKEGQLVTLDPQKNLVYKGVVI
jgi:pyruvate kinase